MKVLNTAECKSHWINKLCQFYTMDMHIYNVYRYFHVIFMKPVQDSTEMNAP